MTIRVFSNSGLTSTSRDGHHCGVISEIYLTGLDDLDEAARVLREVLNLPLSNRSPGTDPQRRESLNMGGTYYLFEVLGVSLSLVRNSGEARVPAMAHAPLYVLVETAGEDPVEAVARHIATVLARAGVACEIESR